MHRIKTSATASYDMQPAQKNSPMAMEIDGVTYYTAADICRELGVSRQTL